MGKISYELSMSAETSVADMMNVDHLENVLDSNITSYECNDTECFCNISNCFHSV